MTSMSVLIDFTSLQLNRQCNRVVPNTQAVSIRFVCNPTSVLHKNLSSLNIYLADLLRVASCTLAEDAAGRQAAKYDVKLTVANGALCSLDDNLLIIHLEPVEIYVSKAGNCKCPRCWRFASAAENELCTRCTALVPKQ